MRYIPRTTRYAPHAIIDVETAKGFDADYQPICSIAFCLSNPSGDYSEPVKYFVRPPNNEISADTTEVHGITPDMTANAPEFKEVWQEAEKYLLDRVLLAHNADFDFKVIEDEMEKNQIPPTKYSYTCTLDMARSAWPWLGGFGLKNLAENFNITLNHHDPASDAAAAAEVLRHLMWDKKCQDPVRLSKKLDVPVGILGQPPRWKNGLRHWEQIPHFRKSDKGWAVCAPQGTLKKGTVVEVTRKSGELGHLKIGGDIKTRPTAGGGTLEYTFNYDNLTEAEVEEFLWQTSI